MDQNIDKWVVEMPRVANKQFIDNNNDSNILLDYLLVQKAIEQKDINRI